MQTLPGARDLQCRIRPASAFPERRDQRVHEKENTMAVSHQSGAQRIAAGGKLTSGRGENLRSPTRSPGRAR